MHSLTKRDAELRVFTSDDAVSWRLEYNIPLRLVDHARRLRSSMRGVTSKWLDVTPCHYVRLEVHMAGAAVNTGRGPIRYGLDVTKLLRISPVIEDGVPDLYSEIGVPRSSHYIRALARRAED